MDKVRGTECESGLSAGCGNGFNRIVLAAELGVQGLDMTYAMEMKQNLLQTSS